MRRRWRDTTRPRFSELRPFALQRVVLFAVFTGTCWLATAQGAWALLTGGTDPSGGRGWGALWYTLGFFLAAIPTTWVSWLYVRRPVPFDPDAPDPRATPPDERVRAESERRAWRSR